MNNYRELAVRYLKMNKRRSIVTIIGVTIAVTVLYTILNLGWSALLNEREKAREEHDYEMVFFTESKEQIDRIMGDERVKSTYIGSYYGYEKTRDNPKTYDNALYVNTTSPYRMDSIFEKLKEKYGVEGDMNVDLEVTYLQGDDTNLIFVLFLMVLLVSFIFAIFGIGIVRNSIQLSTLEQIKDYGNLRCIGGSKGQLKAVVYLEGGILELTGNGIGIFLGWLGSMIVGHFLDIKVGLHFVPIVPILIAFLGDLYFAMEENCKVIVNLTPVSAIRGEYRIRKEKIKVRKRSIYGKLFGVEGDYAYKNVMRNPWRFLKTVWSIGIGVAAFITTMGIISTANGLRKELNERYRYFQVYYECPLSTEMTMSKVQSALPPAGLLQAFSDMDEVVEAKRMYYSTALLGDWEANYEHYTDEFLAGTGGYYQTLYEVLQKEENVEADDYWNGSWTIQGMTEINCMGYDEEDYARFQSVLVDGTLDVSENGLVLANGGTVEKTSDDDWAPLFDDDWAPLFPEYVQMEFTDYKVGDTIDIVDMAKLRVMVEDEMEVFSIWYEKEKEQGDENGNGYGHSDVFAYSKARLAAAERCRKKLMEEGDYKTYTIEGIFRCGTKGDEGGTGYAWRNRDDCLGGGSHWNR